MSDPRLTVVDRARTVELSLRLQKAIDQFHKELGLPDTDIKIVEHACLVILISQLSRLDAYDAFLHANVMLQGLMGGVKTSSQRAQEEALYGGRSS